MTLSNGSTNQGASFPVIHCLLSDVVSFSMSLIFLIWDSFLLETE
jgi:hypothetical protein